MSLKPLYLVQTGTDGHILNQGCYTAFYAAKSLGYPINTYRNEIDVLKYLEDRGEKICIGGIDTLRKIIDLLGCKQPEVHPPHIHLPNFVGREITEITLGELRQNNIPAPYFIKPLVLDKAFTGYVVIYPDMDLIRLRSLPDDTKLLKSEVVKFVSEYRIFIHNKNIVSAKNYAGRYDIIPDFTKVQLAIEAYIDQKVAYSLDFGITDKGETLLIEINDAFGIAPYGLEPTTYLKMLSARWNEIIKTKKEAIYNL